MKEQFRVCKTPHYIIERNYTTVFIALFLVGKYLFQLEPIIVTVVASHKTTFEDGKKKQKHCDWKGRVLIVNVISFFYKQCSKGFLILLSK